MIANFSVRLKELREERELNQKQLAKAVETSQANISRWENGTSDPGTEWLIKFAIFFEVTTDYLLGVTGDL